MVREILYTITQDTKGVLPATKQWCGMQYEDDATCVIFDLSALGNIKALYRIDFNTSANGYNPSENLTCTDGKISRKIPYSVTKHGGEIQITAVITFLDENDAQTGVCYSYPVFAFLTDVEKCEEMACKIENNVSAMEHSVQNMYSKIQKLGAETEVNLNNALNAAEQTVNAKFTLENGAEFIFLGGNASNKSTLELTVDSELSEDSTNAIQNKAVVNGFKKYSKDYILEQGTSGIWTYRKWNSGLYECWCNYIDTNFEDMKNSVGGLHLGYGKLRFPITFEKIPIVVYNIANTSGINFIGNTDIFNEYFFYFIGSTVEPDPTCLISAYVIGEWQ
ncbi:MAG: hypothetical protein IJP26_00705 [Clostridia bacterium]|nr:hypothetical protein [Clostridia bacterium]